MAGQSQAGNGFAAGSQAHLRDPGVTVRMGIGNSRRSGNWRVARVLRSGVPFLLIACFGQLCVTGQGRSVAPVRPGVSAPGVRRELGSVQPEAVFRIPGMPDWLLVT